MWRIVSSKEGGFGCACTRRAANITRSRRIISLRNTSTPISRPPASRPNRKRRCFVARGRTGQLTKNRLDRNIARMMIKRRARDAGISTRIGCHTFRGTGITAYLENGGTLEKAQLMAVHESPRTTKIYDRTSDQVTLDEIERIAIQATRLVTLSVHLSPAF